MPRRATETWILVRKRNPLGGLEKPRYRCRPAQLGKRRCNLDYALFTVTPGEAASGHLSDCIRPGARIFPITTISRMRHSSILSRQAGTGYTLCSGRTFRVLFVDGPRVRYFHEGLEISARDFYRLDFEKP